MSGGRLNERLNGARATQAKLDPTTEPFTVVPAEPLTTVPAPSSRAQRAASPVVAVESCAFAVDWICACDRALFQIRASSSAPSKNPCAVVPFERIEEASAAGWMLADCTG